MKAPFGRENSPPRKAFFWFFTETWRKSSLGGASADAQSYWQGRFAACTFVERVWHTGRPWNCWGVAPNPTRDRRKGTKSPIDPFSRLSWSCFHAPYACSFLVLRLSPCLLPPTFREEPLFSICEEMRRMKPDASAPPPFRAGFRPMRDAEKNPHNNQKSNHEPCVG